MKVIYKIRIAGGYFAGFDQYGKPIASMNPKETKRYESLEEVNFVKDSEALKHLNPQIVTFTFNIEGS